MYTVNKMRALIITLSLAGLLAACGHKTGLELPKPKPAAATPASAPVSTTPSPDAK